MKKIILLLILITTSLGFSQGAAPTAPIRNASDVISVFCGAYSDIGASFFPDWGQGTTFEQVTLDGDTALHYSNLDYQGVQFDSPINASTMTKLHIDVWTPNVSPFNVYLIAGGESAVTLTPTLSGWNSFDIDLTQYSSAGRTLNNIIQFKFEKPGFAYHAESNSIYLDNIYFWKPANVPTLSNFSIATKTSTSAPFSLTAPTSNSSGSFSYTSSNTSVATVSGSTVTIIGLGSTVITATQAASGSYGSGTISATLEVTPPAAPNPTISSNNLIALYTDSYQAYDVFATVDTFATGWSAATLTPIVIGSNNTLKYSNLSYVGIEMVSNPVNASGMNLFHVDMFTPNMTSFGVKLVDFGADGAYGGGDDREHQINLTPTQNGWNSYNLLLSDFTGLTTIAHIAQIILVGNNNGTAYIDNMYFGNQVIAVAPALSNFAIPAKITGDSDFAITAPISTSPGAFTYSSSNTSVATIVGGNSIHIVGIGTTTITATQAASGNYLSGTITASFVVTAPIAQAPTTAAPTPPTRNAWDVVSLYSGAYSNATLNELPTGWSQLTDPFEVVNIAGNSTWKFKGEFLGIVTNYDTGVNLSQMTTMHIDYWTPDTNRIDLKLVNTVLGGEAFTALEPTTVTGTWRSIDVPLTNYGSLNKSNITQILIDPAGVSKIYIDNLYFYRAATSLPAPTLSGFALAPKVVGDASFTLTAPTSNSTGAFTYTSSNTAVATISGNTVTIVGAGSTTITATQAAAGSYGEGVITTNFIVSFPPPATAAPTPTVPADRVLSLYSNAYSNVSGTDWYPNWGQSTQVSNVLVAGNDTKKYESLNYQGVQLANPVDVSSMTSLHIDMWTPNCTTFEVFLVNQALPAGQVGFSGEQSVSVSPTQSGWNSFDIPLSSYSSLELNHIQQLKLVATPFGTTTAYLDNIYFTRPTPNVVAPTVTAVVNLCKGATAIPLTASVHTGNTLKWYTVGGTTAVPTYTIITTGAPSPATTTVASPSKVYAVSEVYSNGTESAKAKITVNVVALPTTPTTLTGTAAQGILVGTSTTATYTTSTVTGASSYLWTVPTGVNIISGQGTTSVVVDFNDVSAGAGAIGSISVQSVNSNGCNSVAKSLALTKALPAAPTTLVMTVGSTTTAITDISKYAGTSTALTLTAGVSASATSYVWTLPDGVNVISGNASSDKVITVKFNGVSGPCSISVKAKNGVGSSATAKTLALTATVPAVSSTLVLTNGVSATAISNISIYAGTSTAFTLTAGVSALATSYEWTLPDGVNVISGNPLTDQVITVKFNGVSGPCSISVKAKNGVGSSATAKTLALTATVPAVSSTLVMTDGVGTTAITNISKYAGTSTALTLTAGVSALATSYEWTLPTGVNVISGNPLTDQVITVKFNGVSGPCSISVKAKNGVGSSATAKTLALTATVPAVVSAVTGQLTGICSSSTVTYTITASALANFYKITAPANSVVKSATNTSNLSNILTTSDLVFTVTYPAGFVVNSTTLAANKTIVITSINGVGPSATNKTLTLTSGACMTAKESNLNVLATEASIYPNPAREEFNIELNSIAQGQMEMTIISLNGSVVASKTIQLSEGTNVINENVSSLTTGVYFVRLTNTSSNDTIIKKLIKE
jgi:hypothetical protein